MNIRDKPQPLQLSTTLALLRTFETLGHCPSEEMVFDLHNTARYLEQMADGHLAPMYYLNSLPTGVGKTTLIISFVRELVRSDRHKDVGVIICLPYLQAIKAMIGELALAKDLIGVYTRDDDTNNLGADNHNRAQVLITTQQMVEARLSDGKQFGELDYFHFKGKPRIVKIWDEALLPWEELIVNRDEIARLPLILRNNGYGPLADALHKVCSDVEKLKPDSPYQFPELGDIEDWRKDVLGKQDEVDRKIAHTLCKLSGKTVRVINDPMTGLCSISWQDSLPKDFMPVVVFDASGKARTAYQRYGKASGLLQVITTATKRYDNVTFWHVDMGGGKDAWRENTEELLSATAACIKHKEPDKACLVIHHQADQGKPVKGKIPHIPDALRERHAVKDNVSFLNWGKHRQTNDFRDREKIVLAGLLYLPERVVTVRARGAMQKPSNEDLAKDDFKAVERGEVANDFVQSVGRICVRRCDGDQALPADVYVIASNRGSFNVPDLLRETFPGCTVEALALPGMAKKLWHQAVEYVDTFWSKPENACKWIAIADLQKALGVKHRQNFNRDVRKHPEFIRAMEKRKVVETGKAKRKTHLWKQS